MGGWGEPRHDSGKRLADAVRRWLNTRNTGDEQRVASALAEYDEQRDPRNIAPPPGPYC